MTTSEPLLQVRDLRVDIGERNVLNSLSLDVEAGALLVLMGANGSGKSTFGLALAGHPRYRVSGGSARFAGQDLLALAPHERSRAGLFVSFQAPPDIPGVKNNLFIRSAMNAQRQARGEAPIDAFDFLADARGAARRVGLAETLLGRPVIDGVRAVVDEVQALRAQGTAFVVISHYLQLIEALQPDRVLRLADGGIAETGALDLARDIARHGFARAAATVGA